MADAEATIDAPAPEAEPQGDAVAEAPVAANKPAKEKKAKKEKKSKKDKKGGEESGEVLDGPSLAGHPRAARSVEHAKGWGALIGFVAGGYLSLPTHTVADAGLRALIAGVVLYVAAWAGSVFFWRRMVMVEIRAREQELLAAARAAAERRRVAAGETPQGAVR